MPQYGDANYWNERYTTDNGSPFDWLFDYNDVALILEQLLPDKQEQIVLVGCGNAPFSPDLYSYGRYSNLINIDLSEVVIEQQKVLFPQQKWEVMNVLNMTFQNESIPVVIDKSLIDTLLCYNDSKVNTNKMIQEIYRVLEPGGRFLSFSLHAISEVNFYYNNPVQYNWKANFYNIKSSRWNEDNHVKRSVAHTMIVCDKPYSDGTYRGDNYPLVINGALSDNEYNQMKDYAAKIILRNALKEASVDELLQLLANSINRKIITSEEMNNSNQKSSHPTKNKNEIQNNDHFHSNSNDLVGLNNIKISTDANSS
eukprot:gene9750-13117_t